MINIELFWQSVLEQNAKDIKMFFHDSAYVNWHCSNEHFTVDEFVRANCEYPGEWAGDIERMDVFGDLIVTVTRVYPKDRTASFHAVSFIHIQGDKIISIDEYWGDDGDAPAWRLEKHIGSVIKNER